MIRSIFDTYGTPILFTIFLVLFLVESKFESRKRVQGRWKRVVINLIVAIPAVLLLRLALIPAMVWLAIQNQTWQVGVNYWYNAPMSVKCIVTILLLDYTNYLWHILLHKLPVLWRFHLVHHSDMDLDITTAFRFHFGEMIASVIFRGLAVIIIGASPAMVLVYEILFEAATQFHHSNTKMPLSIEEILNFIFVTPRMHGIHHSVNKNETDSNYSVIFSFWDRLHRTLNIGNFNKTVTIGVPAYNHPAELTIGKLLRMPFTTIKQWDNKVPSTNKKNEK